MALAMLVITAKAGMVACHGMRKCHRELLDAHVLGPSIHAKNFTGMERRNDSLHFCLDMQGGHIMACRMWTSIT